MGNYDEHKRQVLEVSQTLSEQGYFGTKSGSAGNVSVLIEGEEAIAVTPSGRKYGDIAVYRNRRDVNAVIHTHQVYASIFSILNEPIPALFDEVTVAIGSTIDVVPYGVSGSPQLLENVVSKLDNRCHCYLLQNHGALCVGRNLDKTVNYVELLEKTASIYYRALATGRPITTLPDPLTEVLFRFVTKAQDVEIARKDSLQQSQ
jgi:L-fuculose-phosphate aldolase